jgi:prophage DNA circulation protein
MSAINNSYPGSFNGAEFLINSHSMDFGRKAIVHEFPNSDARYVEDIGKLNPTFKIEAIIYGQGSDYYSKRDNLINQLNIPGIGLLSHPFYGAILAAPITHTVNETISEVNICRFSMTFAQSGPNISVSAILGSVSEIFDIANEAITLVDDSVQSVYNVSTTYPANYNDSYSKITDVSTSVQTSAALINTDSNYINDFSSTLLAFIAASNEMVTDSTELSEQVSGLLLAGNNLAASPEDGFSFFQDLFDFGDDDVDLGFTTVPYAERIANRGILNSAVQALALIYAFKNAAVITYTTIDQISTFGEALNTQFAKVYASDYLSNDTLTQLAELRIAMAEFYKQAEINVFKITQITTPTIPATVLAYQYYADISEVDNLVSINDVHDISFMSGTVDILTQ